MLDDLLAGAQRLADSPLKERQDLADQLVFEAHAAHQFTKRLGRPHPRWGNGSLMTRALQGLHAPKGPLCFASLAIMAAAVDRFQRGTSRLRLGPACGLDCRARARYANLIPNQGASMAETKAKLTAIDPVWSRVRDEAFEMVRIEPLLGGLVHSSLLHHPTLERALAYRFSLKLASGEMSEQILREIADEAYAADAELGQIARADIMAVYDRDPACHRFIQPLLFFKGFQAIQAYRIGHWLWVQGRTDMAYFVQMRVSEVFGVDVHPAARIGRGIMIDHAHSIVIGETAVIGDNVSMLHSVTLGGTGKEDGDRHPKIGNGVLIGAGAKVLGNISIGRNSRIAAGSVVLEDVPACKTVAGVPARIVGDAGCDQPSITMDQRLKDCDC